jgi:hypothetical protein
MSQRSEEAPDVDVPGVLRAAGESKAAEHAAQVRSAPSPTPRRRG